jgi:prepilin-type N-terminal cleavage/methylation domain-containing protein
LNNRNNSKKVNKNQTGFTLIEVVLVLAIGGLIFLLAFLAFQQVATNRKDSQRRADAARIVAELENQYVNTKAYPANSAFAAAANVCNPGSTVTSFRYFFATYLCNAGSFKSPTGSNYTTQAPVASVSSITIVDGIYYQTNSKCSNGGETEVSLGNVAVQIKLEKGVVCRDNAVKN